MPLTKTIREEVISKGYKAMKQTLKNLKNEGLNIAVPLNGTKQELTLALIWLTNVSICEGYVDLVHDLVTIEYRCIYLTTLEGKTVKLFLSDDDISQLRRRHKKELGDIQPHDYIKCQGKQIGDSFNCCDITDYKEQLRKPEDCTKEQIQKIDLHCSIYHRVQKDKERFNNWMTDNFYSAGDKYYLSTHPDNYLYYTLEEIKEQYKATK